MTLASVDKLRHYSVDSRFGREFREGGCRPKTLFGGHGPNLSTGKAENAGEAREERKPCKLINQTINVTINEYSKYTPPLIKRKKKTRRGRPQHRQRCMLYQHAALHAC